MADLSDVEAGIVATLARVIYPDGTAAASIAGVPCKIYRGWPIPANLDKDLKAGKINLSVFPLEMESRTTRYAREWLGATVPTPTMTLAASDTTITVGGTPSSPLNATAMINDTGYVYPVQPGNTLQDIATGLASLINLDTPATSSGASITVTGAYRIAVRVGATHDILREIRRQKRQFQITCWCPTPTTRDLIAGEIDVALADIDFLFLPDGSAGRLLYERSRVLDSSEIEGLYRRDLIYSVEYATTDGQSATQIVVESLNLQGWDGRPLLPHSGSLLLEAGGYLLVESGGYLTLEP